MTPDESRQWHPEHPDPESSLDILPFYDWIANVIPQGAVCLEIGVYYGRSLAFLGGLRPDLTLYALDPWEGTPGPTQGGYQPLGCNYLDFVQAMQTHAPEVLPQVRVLRGYSQNLLRNFEPRSLDFVFIDGSHVPSAVAADITACLPLLKPSGVIAGHDFCRENGIPEAVRGASRYTTIKLAPSPDDHPGWFIGSSSVWSIQPKTAWDRLLEDDLP